MLVGAHAGVQQHKNNKNTVKNKKNRARGVAPTPKVHMGRGASEIGERGIVSCVHELCAHDMLAYPQTY